MAGRRRRTTPEGHRLYWVYVNYKDGNYNFDTSTTLPGAREAMREFHRDGGVESIEVFWGNTDSAFTQFDPVMSWRP